MDDGLSPGRAVGGDIDDTGSTDAEALEPPARCDALSASLSALPALNFGTKTSGTRIRSEGRRGFTPIRALRTRDENVPNPAIVTSSCRARASVTAHCNASTIS